MLPSTINIFEKAAKKAGRILVRDFVEIEKFFSWMAVLNSIRLVLGTRLDVSEEDEFDFEKSHSPEQTLFVWLAMLLEEAVSASTFYVEDFNKR